MKYLKDILIKIDQNCEMLEIYEGEKRLFVGNYWDFNRPNDIVKLLGKLGHNVVVQEYKFE
mgnify:CR=1 FL=1